MRKVWRDALDQVTPYVAGPPWSRWSRELGLASVIRLSANENPLGPSPRVVESAAAEAARVTSTPTAAPSRSGRPWGPGSASSRPGSSSGNGADELLVVHRARRRSIPATRWSCRIRPSSPTAPRRCSPARPGGEPPARLRDGSGRHDAARDRADQGGLRLHAAQSGVDLVPRGAASPLHRVAGRRTRRSWSWTRPIATSAIDPETPDGVALAREFPFVISLRTFSKIAGLAGLRVGYAIARPEIIEPAQPGARALQREPPRPGRGGRRAGRPRASRAHPRPTCSPSGRGSPRRSGRRGATVPTSQSNFLLVKVDERADAYRQALLKTGILVRDGAGVGFPGHLRITIGTRRAMRALLEVWDRTSGRLTRRAEPRQGARGARRSARRQ